jgi:hypothetical protein
VRHPAIAKQQVPNREHAISSEPLAGPTTRCITPYQRGACVRRGKPPPRSAAWLAVACAALAACRGGSKLDDRGEQKTKRDQPADEQARSTSGPAHGSPAMPGGSGGGDEARAHGQMLAGGSFVLPQRFRQRPMISDMVAGGLGRGAKLHNDTDGDGLTNAEEQALGTSPTNRDTDGDALWDGWEVHGVNGFDLHARGASPLHRDVFVLMDYMARGAATNGLAPNDKVIARIVQAFANAPAQNPDRTSGIALHLERGVEIPYDQDLNPLEQEFYAIKAAHFMANRAPIFHYMIWADTYDGETSSGYSMAIPGSDFIVTLGSWNNNRGGTDDEKVGTFLHELGHNLGLRHGSADDVNHKPNHLSVMNYDFQVVGVMVDGKPYFSYQPFPIGIKIETALDEAKGLGATPQLRSYRTIWYDSAGTPHEGPASGSIDWNGDGKINEGTVSVDINLDSQRTVLTGTLAEWSALVYANGIIGSDQSRTGILKRARTRFQHQPFRELTAEQVRILRNMLKR